MSNLIKTVTNKGQFPLIFTNFFQGKDIFLKTKSGNLLIQYLGFSEGNVAFRIPKVKNISSEVVVFTRHKTNTIYLAMKFFEVHEDTFTFIPIKFQILSDARKESRENVDIESEGSTNVVYAHSFVSDFLIERALSLSLKKVDQIDEIATFDLEKQFENSKVVFISQAKNDLRMKYLIENDHKPLHITTLNEDPPPAQKELYDFYLEEIYSKDYKLSRNHKFISEATVPILFRNMLLYGYIQVNNTRSIGDGQLEVVKRIAIVVNELCKKNNLITIGTEKLLISDLSSGGVGVVFKDRKLIKYFKKNGKVSFEMLLPTRKKVVAGAIVRNITFLENGIIKAGCEYFYLDPTSKANYDEYINSIKK